MRPSHYWNCPGLAVLAGYIRARCPTAPHLLQRVRSNCSMCIFCLPLPFSPALLLPYSPCRGKIHGHFADPSVPAALPGMKPRPPSPHLFPSPCSDCFRRRKCSRHRPLHSRQHRPSPLAPRSDPLLPENLVQAPQTLRHDIPGVLALRPRQDTLLLGLRHGSMSKDDVALCAVWQDYSLFLQPGEEPVHTGHIFYEGLFGLSCLTVYCVLKSLGQ